MAILLVTATDLEMRAVLDGIMRVCPDAVVQYAPGCKRQDAFPPLLPHDLPTLVVPGGRVRLLVCGVGPVAAALVLGEALGTFSSNRISGVVNMGIGGSYDLQALPVGALALATEETLPEYGLVGDEGIADARGIAFAQAMNAKGPIYASLTLKPKNALGNMGLNCHNSATQSIFATVAGVSGTPARAGALAKASGALVENMEGFALALGAARRNLPFAELRAVSNAAGLRPPASWDAPGALRVLGEAAGSLFIPLCQI